MLREIAATAARCAGCSAARTRPGRSVRRPRRRSASYLLSHVDNYWHPVGTAKMGPESDPTAVADHRGAVRGIEGCLVADCALMPMVPRATTAMPAMVIGERDRRLRLGGEA